MLTFALVAGVLAGISVAATAASASGTTLYVATGGSDAGSCQTQATPCASISYAVSQASALPGDVTISVAAGTYDDNVVFSSAVSWTSLTIDGSPTTPTGVDGTSSGSVFSDASNVAPTPPPVTLDHLVVEDGSTSGTGGGIDTSGTMTVIDSTVSNNSATGDGGGISSTGISSSTLTVTDSTISDNNSAAYGGGIASGGNTTVTDSTISGNSAPSGGGGTISGGSALTITDSTISDNNTGDVYPDSGGGMYMAGPGLVTVANSTIASNGAWAGGGIANGGSPLVVTDTTIAENAAYVGGGIAGEDTSLGASIVAANTAQAYADCDLSGSITDAGYNLDDDGSCGFSKAHHDLSDTNPALDPARLRNNGGPTETIALEPGSPAIDHVAQASLCPDADQRGNARSVPCDIGAYDTDMVSAPLEITTASLPNAAPHAEYSHSLAATGGNPPYKWSVSSGHLPMGLHLKKSTGVISGKPKGVDDGTYTFTVRVVDHKTPKVKGHVRTYNQSTKVLSIAIS